MKHVELPILQKNVGFVDFYLEIQYFVQIVDVIKLEFSLWKLLGEKCPSELVVVLFFKIRETMHLKLHKYNRRSGGIYPILAVTDAQSPLTSYIQ